MTREERELSITYLEEMKENYIEGEGYERHPLPEYYAIEYAIKALEQEPCEDAVSRKAVKELLDEYYAELTLDEKALESNATAIKVTRNIINDIESLPHVTPKSETVTEFADRCRECGREKVLDKIRAEIEQITDTMGVSYNQYVSKIDVLQIIDKYKAESEE